MEKKWKFHSGRESVSSPANQSQSCWFGYHGNQIAMDAGMSGGRRRIRSVKHVTAAVKGDWLFLRSRERIIRGHVCFGCPREVSIQKIDYYSGTNHTEKSWQILLYHWAKRLGSDCFFSLFCLLCAYTKFFRR